jgi:hypothetical protein
MMSAESGWTEEPLRKLEDRPWVEWLARFGYGVKGVIYVLVGFLAGRVAMGLGGEIEGPDEALETIGEQPLGLILLSIVAFGLFAYALWRFVQAWVDPDDAGATVKGIIIRLMYVAVGLIYVYFGVLAVRILMGYGGNENDGNEQAEHWTGVLLAQPFGPWLVGAIGLGIVGAGLYQIYYGVGGHFHYKLQEKSMSRWEEWWTMRIGQAGFIAWGVIYLIIGGFLILAGVQYNPEQAMDLVEALETVLMQPAGPWLLGGIAFGLFLYGVFHLIMVRYRALELDILSD